jgi:hypothetical protein
LEKVHALLTKLAQVRSHKSWCQTRTQSAHSRCWSQPGACGKEIAYLAPAQLTLLPFWQAVAWRLQDREALRGRLQQNVAHVTRRDRAATFIQLVWKETRTRALYTKLIGKLKFQAHVDAAKRRNGVRWKWQDALHMVQVRDVLVTSALRASAAHSSTAPRSCMDAC